MLGLAYKKNTGDARESPSQRISKLLVDSGASVSVADPHVSENFTPTGVTLVEATEQVCAAADLVVLLVDHDCFDTSVTARPGSTKR